MPTFYSPEGNPEVWDKRPNGYYSEAEWLNGDPPPSISRTPPAKVGELAIDKSIIAARLSKKFFELLMLATGLEAHGQEQAAQACRHNLKRIAAAYVSLIAVRHNTEPSQAESALVARLAASYLDLSSA